MRLLQTGLVALEPAAPDVASESAPGSPGGVTLAAVSRFPRSYMEAAYLAGPFRTVFPTSYLLPGMHPGARFSGPANKFVSI